MEAPPGNTVLCRNHGGVVLEQRRHLFGDGGQGLGLERHDDKVLGADLGRIIGAPGSRGQGLAANTQAQPVGAHRVEVGAAGNQGHLGIGERQLDTQDSLRWPQRHRYNFSPLRYRLNRSLGPRRRDFGVIVADHCLQDFIRMLTQQR